MTDAPAELVEVIWLRPGIWPNWTLERRRDRRGHHVRAGAGIEGLDLDGRVVDLAAAPRAAGTGRRGCPTSMIATISSDVATGRRMKGRDGTHRRQRRSHALSPPAAVGERRPRSSLAALASGSAAAALARRPRWRGCHRRPAVPPAPEQRARAGLRPMRVERRRPIHRAARSWRRRAACRRRRPPPGRPARARSSPRRARRRCGPSVTFCTATVLSGLTR